LIRQRIRGEISIEQTGAEFLTIHLCLTRMMAMIRCLVFALLILALPVSAQQVTRAEAVAIGLSFVEHRWEPGSKSARHGKDAAGIEVHTPDREGGHVSPVEEGWVAGATNIGMPYKWGGFDTLVQFDAGIRAGKTAGDVYTAEKRRLGGAAVSAQAVGIDCSGFVSRCWKLPKKHSTGMLFGICKRLPSAKDLLPGDVMNTSGGHVLLFVRWLDEIKSRALFYEAAPFSKTRASERELVELVEAGYAPLRYRHIR